MPPFSRWMPALLALLLALTPLAPAGAQTAEPPAVAGRRVGLLSTAAACVRVGAGQGQANATVRLRWAGDIDAAYLVLAVGGSEGGHSLYINGQRIGAAPARPAAPECQPGLTPDPLGGGDRIAIPAGVLRQGENTITLTNDADRADGWTAAGLHVEIEGVLSGPPVSALAQEGQPAAPAGVGAQLLKTSVVLTSTYEQAVFSRVVTQTVALQIPTSYTPGTPAPLLIAVHGYGGTGADLRDDAPLGLAAEAEARGWLMAAPDMHGLFYINTGMYALGYTGAQRDIVDTVNYMLANYTVDTSRIYLIGVSMGGEMSLLTASKYPDVFAAAAVWKPPTGIAVWHDEVAALSAFGSCALSSALDVGPYCIALRLRNETTAYPAGFPFEYQRRSPVEYARNLKRLPVRLWHHQADLLVPVHHSLDIRDAINAQTPSVTAALITSTVSLSCSSANHLHCWDPDMTDLADFVSGYTRATAVTAPATVNVRTDESGSFHWLNVARASNSYATLNWTEVQASYSAVTGKITAVVTDTQTTTLGFNLGAAALPVVNAPGLSAAGLGRPAGVYVVQVGSTVSQQVYTSGYLTVTVPAGTPTTVVISPFSQYLPVVWR